MEHSGVLFWHLVSLSYIENSNTQPCIQLNLYSVTCSSIIKTNYIHLTFGFSSWCKQNKFRVLFFLISFVELWIVFGNESSYFLASLICNCMHYKHKKYPYCVDQMKDLPNRLRVLTCLHRSSDEKKIVIELEWTNPNSLTVKMLLLIKTRHEYH